MSSRLVLLPKKSYTPWNAANVERVLRDERLERERLEKERKIEAQREEEGRIAQIKQQGGDEHASKETAQNAEHVNLFYKEEKEVLQQGVMMSKTNQDGSRDVSAKGARLEQDGGVLPVRLGGDELDRRVKGQRFKWERNHDDEQKNRQNLKEQKLKDSMDPMRMFCRKADNQNLPGNDQARRRHEDSMRMLSRVLPSSDQSSAAYIVNGAAADSRKTPAQSGNRHYTRVLSRRQDDHGPKTDRTDTKYDNKPEQMEPERKNRRGNENDSDKNHVDDGHDDSLEDRRGRSSRSSGRRSRSERSRRRRRRGRRRREDSIGSSDDDGGDKRRKRRRHHQRTSRRSGDSDRNDSEDETDSNSSNQRRR